VEGLPGRSEGGEERNMPTIDLQITAKIRAILARHWIDPEKLHFRTSGGTVRFNGVLARQGAYAVCNVDGTFVEVLVDEIRRTPGVEKVYFTGVEIERRRRVVGATDGEEALSGDATRSRGPQPVELEPEPELPG
jgi:hypothetical protein